jgi:hypothetical protein
VNDVVGYARVVLMAWQQLIENLSALLLPRICLIGRIEIPDCDQLEGMEDRSLVIIGMAFADSSPKFLLVEEINLLNT